jgi:hypothetical protein
MKDIIFSIIIAINLVSSYFLASTLISYWKYLLPKRKYSYLILLFFIIVFTLFLMGTLKNYFSF